MMELRGWQVAHIPPARNEPRCEVDFYGVEEERLKETVNVEKRAAPDHGSSLWEKERRPTTCRCRTAPSSAKEPIESSDLVLTHNILVFVDLKDEATGEFVDVVADAAPVA